MNTALNLIVNAARLPRTHATIPPDVAGRFTYFVTAYTDVIGGTVISTKRRIEQVRIDPDAPLEDDCLVVFVYEGGATFMGVCELTGRNYQGRYVRSGSPEECLYLSPGPNISRADLKRGDCLRVLGRVVGEPRPLRTCLGR